MHWGVPEGSYASEPDGAARVREFRGMVCALHRRGLRVVLDVVYNHTFHSARDGAPPAQPHMFGLIVRSLCCSTFAVVLDCIRISHTSSMASCLAPLALGALPLSHKPLRTQPAGLFTDFSHNHILF